MGLVLETIWHHVVERRYLKTPHPAVRAAIRNALVRWPTVYVLTAGALRWAEWRVEKAEGAESGTRTGSSSL